MKDVKIIFEKASDKGYRLELEGTTKDIMFALGKCVADLSKNSNIPVNLLLVMIEASAKVWSEE